MKIIYITNNRIPSEKAHSFQVMKMCEAFSNTGTKMELWIPRRFNLIKDTPFEYYGMREIFTIKKISVIDLIPFEKFFGRFTSFIESLTFSFFAFKKAIKEADCIVYSRDQFILWILSFSRYKFVYEMHVFPHKPGFYKRIWKKSDKIIVITKNLKNLLIKYGIDAGKILVAPDAVDLSVFSAVIKERNELKSELGLPQEIFLVGYVGKFKTLGMEKGIKTMIEALSILEKDIKMVFVGGEVHEIKDYKSFANKFNVLSQCIFVDYQPYSKIVRYMKAIDALVIPFPNEPHYAFYASPLKLFEYMASGRPIIASDLPALREILNDKNALFFKPDDAGDLARVIKILKSSQTLGYHLSQQALADVKEYTWDNRAKNILNFIQ